MLNLLIKAITPIVELVCAIMGHPCVMGEKQCRSLERRKEKENQ